MQGTPSYLRSRGVWRRRPEPIFIDVGGALSGKTEFVDEHSGTVFRAFIASVWTPVFVERFCRRRGEKSTM